MVATALDSFPISSGNQQAQSSGSVVQAGQNHEELSANPSVLGTKPEKTIVGDGVGPNHNEPKSFPGDPLMTSGQTTTKKMTTSPLPGDLIGHSQATPQTTLSDRVCIDGKLVPQFFMLGAMKCSTTQISKILFDAGMVGSTAIESQAVSMQHYIGKSKANWRSSKKEHHLFDDDIFRNTTLEKAGQIFRALWPPCSLTEWLDKLSEHHPLPKRAVIADMTPNYLPMIHEDADKYEAPVQWERFRHLPALLSYLYGPAVRALSFVVSMREPLKRMQSQFYHNQGWGRIPADRKFIQDFEPVIDGYAEGRYEPMLWLSMYGRQLKGWFAHMDNSQFVVFPYLYFLVPPHPACTVLEKRIRLDVRCDKIKYRGSSHKHAPLNEDVPVESKVWHRAVEIFTKENMLLFQTLATAFTKGACLPGFVQNDSSHPVQQIESWVVAGWR